ncbi:MAG: homoserine O-succinyltransferase [Candidatus Promineifilaceae bacterium]|nr:homoserine O-succinyltransferase [Candidatus Promineifilaceae bacterium]
MPLVAHTPLPTYDALRGEGYEVLSLGRALKQDIRELHVGLLNIMPDAALTVTEEQYMHLVGSCNQIVQFYIHPFTVPGLPRSPEVQAYIDAYYDSFDELKEQGLDALIVTGANVTNPALEVEPFWEPLQEVLSWASKHLASVLCSCLASHALLKLQHGIERRRLPRKQWGVFTHRVRNRSHPLLHNINTRFEMPHSRWNEVTAEQLEAAGLHILIDSDEAGVQMAVSPDHFRFVYMQGHPEYFRISLLKEYKREVMNYLDGKADSPPPQPANYFDKEATQIDKEYLMAAEQARKNADPLPPFPEEALDPHIDNTWGDTGKALFNNWLGLVYQLTHPDRHIPFMPHVDPHDPLNLRSRPGEPPQRTGNANQQPPPVTADESNKIVNHS